MALGRSLGLRPSGGGGFSTLARRLHLVALPTRRLEVFLSMVVASDPVVHI